MIRQYEVLQVSALLTPYTPSNPPKTFFIYLKETNQISPNIVLTKILEHLILAQLLFTPPILSQETSHHLVKVRQ